MLLARIADAEVGALGELYDRYGRLIYSLAMNIVYDSGIAEEVTQDVFIELWRKAGQYQSSQGKVITWLSTIARNRAIDNLRRMNVRPEGHRVGWSEDIFPNLHDPFDLEQSIELDQQKSLVHSALAQLPEEQRESLALAYFQGYSHQQISEALNEPLGTVKTRLRLAMRKLRDILIDSADI
ncbi:MAG: sigma-70 family RNA polymerase sigma factor [Chloroflexi bacterium]|nr:sigma-70 family RNA polymerase sigma factor [Chloroflexota bacterium]